MSDITIISHKRTNNFTIVPNHIINADYLKLEDKAFLIWVLSRPDDWKLNTLSLAKIHGVCKDKITTISKRLQKHDHLIIKKGSFGTAQWLVFENVQDCSNFRKKQKNTPVDPIDKPYPEKQDKLHPEIHDPEKQDALLRTDPLPRTDQQKPCSQKREPKPITDAEILFPMLKSAWPNNNNMKRALSPFKALIHNKPSTESFALVEHLKWDIEERIRLNQYGFNKMMLSTYLNGERWLDDMPVPDVDEKQQAKDRGDEASAAKGRELFGR